MKKREINLIIILIVLLCGLGYYLLWYIPTTTRVASLQAGINAKKQGIEDAVQQIVIWASLSEAREKTEDEWARLNKTLPENFDEGDVLESIERIIIPHTRDVSIRFSDVARALETTEIRSVRIEFTTTYDALQAILGGLAAEKTFNRVSDMNFRRAQPMGNDAEMSEDLIISMSVDFMTALT